MSLETDIDVSQSVGRLRRVSVHFSNVVGEVPSW
jgi:hypothetical protein